MFCVLMAGAICTSCSSGEVQTSETSTGQVSQSSQSIQESTQQSQASEENEVKFLNPLTGLEIGQTALDSKPVAVMINNIEYAQPLLGISKADIAYECLVEGGITRIEAVYKDISDVKTVGSIRSARPPFIELARGLDALYIYCGTSKQANTLLKQDVISHFDLAYYGDMAWRDQERINEGYSSEHTLVTDGKSIVSQAKSDGIEMKSDKSYPQKFGDNTQCKQGETAEEVTAIFSSYKSTTFKYDSESKKYTVWQFGEEQYDNSCKCANQVENVLILNVNSYLIDEEHVNLDLVGTGEGYYCNGGKYIEIGWEKKSSDEPLVYTAKSGEELIMSPGRQYVCCVPLNNAPIFQ